MRISGEKMKIRTGIRGTLLTTLIITGVIPLLIAISITYYVGTLQRKEVIGKSFQQLSEKAQESISVRMISNIRTLRNLAGLQITANALLRASENSDRLTDGMLMKERDEIEKQWPQLTEEDDQLKKILENPLARLFRAFNSLQDAFGEIFATDARGRLVAATNKTSDYWQADEEWWQKSFRYGQGKLYLSEVSFDESAGIYSVDVCIPVKTMVDGEQRVVGIIKGVLDISNVFGSIADIRVEGGGKGMLVSDEGVIVVSRDLNPLEEKLTRKMFPVASGSRSGWFVGKEEDGTKMLVGFARVELKEGESGKTGKRESEISIYTPWTVVVFQELSYAFSPVHKLIWYISLPGITLIGIFFFLGLYVAEKRVASPLSLLTRTVKRVANGDLTRTVNIRSKDELGELASSLNQMVSNIEKRISLDNMSMNMLSQLELNDVLSMTMEVLKTTFNAAFGRVWLVGDGDLCDDCIHSRICPNRELCLHLKVTVGIYANDEDYLRVPIGNLMVGSIAENRKPAMTNHLASDKRIHNVEWFKREGLVSFAAYPLLIGDELLGVLALSCRRPISYEEFVILGSFASRTAMAIQNAGLHSEIRELNLNLERKVVERTGELELANAKLKRADQLKSEFLANMSHELRTPLNAIIGFAEVLRDGIVGQLNDIQIDSVIDIHESGKHLLHMINDILDLSKVEAGKMELQPEEFSLKVAMEGAESIIRDMASKKNISLGFMVPDDLPNIYADPVKFKQIMYNLLSNAVKFTLDGGRVTVGCERIGGNGISGELVISVADTGIGIAPENQRTIFDEFKQLDSSQSRRYEGTGLGLALTKRLVGLHGGRIWVESEGLGKGSKFSFTLPMSGMDSETERIRERLPTIAQLSDSAKGRTILVVEDNPQAAHLLCIYLAEAGYDTVVADDGEKAIEVAREVRPFAITLDVMLPKKDGWQVMQELKNFQDTRDIPVIIVSIVDDQSLGFGMGAVGYLVKPIDRDQLIYTLNNIELEAKTGNASPRILIIDDNSEDLKLMQSILESEGFEVLTASDGASGIAKTVNDRPDLIVLDLIMPNMSGFEVVKDLDNHPEARGIPIIICTVKEITAEDREMLNDKVRSIVQKGADAKTHLLEAVRKMERFH